MKYRRWEDQYASLFGKLLLRRGLADLGYGNLELLTYTSYNRPFLNAEVDFNTSHTKSCTICAVSNTYKLGIDIEKVDKINMLDFTEVWNIKERRDIVNAEDMTSKSYSYWTRKEAVIKSDGRGLSIPLKNVDVRNDQVILDKNHWFLTRVDFSSEYVCHLSTNKKIQDSDVAVREVIF